MDVTPEAQSKLLLGALAQFKEALSGGALISIDERRERVRLLPLKQGVAEQRNARKRV